MGSGDGAGRADATIDPRLCDAVLFDVAGLTPLGKTVAESTGALARRLHDAGVKAAVVDADADAGLPGRPDPATLLAVARSLGVRPGRAAVVGDSGAAVSAARGGGFQFVIGLDRSGAATATLRDCGADVVIGDLAEITVRAIDRRMSQLPDALRSFEQFTGVALARHPAVFFDFDGTLSTIVDQPGAATLVPGADAALRSLAAMYPVGVLSGRDLADIRERVGIPGLWYAGSHGFEIASPDGSVHRNETAAQAVPLLAQAAGELSDQLREIDGVVVEHKTYAVAVHYRNAGPGAATAVTAAVHDAGRRHGLKVTSGRRVVELRPRVDWDKGRTLRWILDRLTGMDPLLPIFVGDDLTDEDGFDAVLHDGVGIVVCHTEDGDRATAARFRLDDPDDVRELIEALVEHRRSP